MSLLGSADLPTPAHTRPDCHIRTVGAYDIWHIFAGILQETYHYTNNWYKRQAIVAYRVFCGPHGSCSFWNQFHDVNLQRRMFSGLLPAVLP